MKKIGIDTLGCGHGKTGIGSYLLSLVANLKNTEDLTFELFGLESDRYTYASDNDFKFSECHPKDKFESQIRWHRYWFDFFTRRKKYDAVLIPAAAMMFPFYFHTKVIAVVHSLISENENEAALFPLPFAFSKRLIKNLSRADRIIASSSIIKKDLEKLGIDGSKISIVFSGIDHSQFYPRDMISESTVEIKPFSIRRPYFVYASSMISPSKKHIELIKAFEMFKKKTHLPHRLVLAGRDGEMSEKIKETARISEFASDIFITGFYPHESFPELYSYSEGCVFPAVGEGVGLPVVEAMATGIPVACSNSGVLPEIAGQNVIFFDSDNIEEMADCFEKLALDKNLRKKLIADSLQWIRRMTWEKTAQRTTEVILDVLKK